MFPRSYSSFERSNTSIGRLGLELRERHAHAASCFGDGLDGAVVVVLEILDGYAAASEPPFLTIEREVGSVVEQVPLILEFDNAGVDGITVQVLLHQYPLVLPRPGDRRGHGIAELLPESLMGEAGIREVIGVLSLMKPRAFGVIRQIDRLNRSVELDHVRL